MKNRRPDGWSSRRTEYLADTRNSFLGVSIEAKRIYEAGADAILEGLRKGKKLTITGFDTEYSGTWYHIPEEIDDNKD